MENKDKIAILRNLYEAIQYKEQGVWCLYLQDILFDNKSDFLFEECKYLTREVLNNEYIILDYANELQEEITQLYLQYKDYLNYSNEGYDIYSTQTVLDNSTYCNPEDIFQSNNYESIYDFCDLDCIELEQYSGVLFGTGLAHKKDRKSEIDRTRIDY